MAELTRRYVVMTMATEGPFDLRDPEGAFVLRPWKDPAALHALRAYAERCYPELARDLAAWIRAIEGGPVVRGDVGRRNEAHAGAASPARRRAAARKAKPGARRPAARKRGRRPPRKRR
jgi:hypothetical protein